MLFQSIYRCRYANYYRYFCSQRKNYYEVLGVPRTATKQEIKDAYFKLSKKYHPDAGGASTSSGKGSHDEFVKVNEAYKVLSKDESRRQYDRSLDDPLYQSPYATPKQSPRYYEPPQRPPPYDSPFNERRRSFDEWEERRYGGSNRSPFDDPWLNQYFRQGQSRHFSPDEIRRGERAFWTVAFTLILITIFLNYMASSMITGGNGDQLEGQRELYEQNRRKAWEERVREEQRFRQRILAEQEEKKRLQHQRQEEEEKLRRIYPKSADKITPPSRDKTDDAPK